MLKQTQPQQVSTKEWDNDSLFDNMAEATPAFINSCLLRLLTASRQYGQACAKFNDSISTEEYFDILTKVHEQADFIFTHNVKFDEASTWENELLFHCILLSEFFNDATINKYRLETAFDIEHDGIYLSEVIDGMKAVYGHGIVKEVK